MKKSVIIVGILMTIIGLYSCKNDNAKSTNNATTTDKTLNIAYVNLDSMQEGLEYFQTKKEEFAKQESAINAEMERLQRDIQNAANAFQRKIDNKNISPVEAENTQKRLQNMQINLQKKQSSLTNSFMEKQAKFNDEFTTMIDDFFVEYNKSKGYDFILTQGPVKSVLYYEPKYDITQDVIKELNVWIKNRKLDNTLNKVVSDTTK